LSDTYQKSVQTLGANADATQRLAVRLAKAEEEEAKIASQIRQTNREMQNQSIAGKQLSDSMNEAGKSVAATTKSLGGILRNTFTNAAGFALGIAGFQGVRAAIQNTVGAGMGFNSQMQQAKISFETMLGSAGKANALIGQLQKMAAETPFEFPDLQDGAKRMLAFGFSAESVIPTLKAVGDAAAGLGMSGREGINRIVLALGQMQAKSKVSAEEMLQLTEAGVPAWDILAKAMGVTTAEVMKLSEKGLIPADKAIQALVQGMEERFPDMMQKQSKSFAGLMSTLRDNLNITFGKVMKPAFEWLTNTALPKVIDLTNNFTAALKSKGAAEAFKTIIPPAVVDGLVEAGNVVKNIFAFIVDHGELVKGILIGVAAGFAAFKTIETAKTAIDGFKAAVAGLPLLTNPVGLAVAAIGLLAFAAYEIYKHWGGIKDFFANLWDGIKSAVSSAANAVWEFLRQWGPLILAAVTGPVGLIVYAVVKHWDDIKDKTAAIWNAVKDFVVSAFKWLYDHNYYFKDLVDYIGKSWDVLKVATEETWNAVKNWLGETWHNISALAGSVWNGIASTLSDIWGNISAALQGAWDSISSATSRAWSATSRTISGIANEIWDVLSGLADRAWEWGSNLMGEFIGGVTARIGELIRTLRRIAEEVASFLGFHSPAKEGPGSDADRWAPNLVRMYAAGIRAGIPEIRAAVMDVAGSLGGLKANVTADINPAPAAAVSGPAILNLTFTGPINVRDDNDIKAISKELFGLVQSAQRGSGRR